MSRRYRSTSIKVQWVFFISFTNKKRTSTQNTTIPVCCRFCHLLHQHREVARSYTHHHGNTKTFICDADLCMPSTKNPVPYDTQICIILYAYDTVLIVPDENKLQILLNFISDWCSKWRMVHFRPIRKTPTAVEFRFGNNALLHVPEYKYLGVHLDEDVSFRATATALVEGASRALGAIRYWLKFLKECRTAAFTELFSSFFYVL